jgi:hypothetical protein
MHGTSAIADARRGEDGAASVEGDRGAYREVASVDDADHEGAIVGSAVRLDVEDGVVAVVAVGRATRAWKMARPTAGAGGCDSVG